MPFWLLLVVTAIYAAVTAMFAADGKYLLALVYFGYSIANVGLVGLAR